MARRNSRRSMVSLSTRTEPQRSVSTRSRRRMNTSCVQSCQRSAGKRALRQQVWQYLLMSVSASAGGSAMAALAGEPARAVPKTTATIIWREFGLEGRNLRIRVVHSGSAFLQLYGWKLNAFSLASPIILRFTHSQGLIPLEVRVYQPAFRLESKLANY